MHPQVIIFKASPGVSLVWRISSSEKKLNTLSTKHSIVLPTTVRIMMPINTIMRKMMMRDDRINV